MGRLAVPTRIIDSPANRYSKPKPKPKTSAVECCTFPSDTSWRGVVVDVESAKCVYSIAGVMLTMARKCVARRQHRDSFEERETERYDNRETCDDDQDIIQYSLLDKCDGSSNSAAST